MNPLLDQIQIASPCSADWDLMQGTDHVRFCPECKKNVFNLSVLTGRQAEALLEKTQGSVCTYLYRRADGTVLTEDCPMTVREGSAISIHGTIKDGNGDPISHGEVTIVNQTTNAKLQILINADGSFEALALSAGIYTVITTSLGFGSGTKKDVKVDGEVHLEIHLWRGLAGAPVFSRADPATD